VCSFAGMEIFRSDSQWYPFLCALPQLGLRLSTTIHTLLISKHQNFHSAKTVHLDTLYINWHGLIIFNNYSTFKLNANHCLILFFETFHSENSWKRIKIPHVIFEFTVV
jgi:hypothetical protein